MQRWQPKLADTLELRLLTSVNFLMDEREKRRIEQMESTPVGDAQMTKRADCNGNVDTYEYANKVAKRFHLLLIVAPRHSLSPV